MSTRIGPFELGAALPQWGSGWHAARPVSADDDDLPSRVLVRSSLTGEAPSLALEGACRMRLRSPSVPELLRRGNDGRQTWLCFRAVAAVKIDWLLDEPVPVPLALGYATAFARALQALESARHVVDADERPTPIGPSFDELLVTKQGDVVVITPPPGTRMSLAGLLKVPHRDRFLVAPEAMRGGNAWGPVLADVYATGSVLNQVLTGVDPQEGVFPRDVVGDVPRVVDDLVRRAMADDPAERYESIDDVTAAIAAAAADWPPVGDDERAAFVRARAGWRIEEAERSFL